MPLTFRVCGSSAFEIAHSGFWLYLLMPPEVKLENPLLVLSIKRESV